MAKAMTSSQKWCPPPCLLILFVLSTTFSLNLVSSSATQPSYYDHCSSTVPPAPSQSEVPLKSLPFARSHDGYYTGGQPVLEPNPYAYSSGFTNSISLRTSAAYYSAVPGLFKLKGRLILPNANKNNRQDDFSYGRRSYYSTVVSSNPQRSSVSFKLEGFWSKSKGKLCMVGSGSTYTAEGNLLNLAVVLKLYGLTNTSNITSLITGTLKSLSSTNNANHFEPISMMILPQMNYKYTSILGDFNDGYSGGTDLPRGLSLSSFPKNTFCSISSGFNQFHLRYDRECISAKNCNPLDAGTGYLPRIMSLDNIDCSEDKEKMRVLLKFSNGSYFSYYQSFNPQTSLVGEGSWDESKHQLRIVACPILGVTGSFTSARVGNCTIRLELLFPAIWSIKNASEVVGQIRTNKTVKESGFFPRIMLRSSSSSLVGSPDLKYEYTQVDTARRLCPKSEKPASTKGKIYPSGPAAIMNLDLEVKNSTRTIAWAYSRLITVGTQFYEHASSPENEVHPDFSSRSLVNISLCMSLNPSYGIPRFNASSRTYEASEIRAEGIYDAETGSLCMVGCRDLGSDGRIPTYESFDCKILVQLHFPSLNSTGGDYIKGSINSTRDTSDRLYFGRLDLSSYYEDGFSIWRMDVEIVLVLISTTLSCIFVVLQIFHVKRHSHVLPFISLVMLSVLALGHLVPLVLNFEALFMRTSSRRRGWWYTSDGWLEANEVIVRVTGMVAFLLQFRLLQKAWSARWSDGNQKSLWAAEKKVLFVALPLYVAGALVPVVVNSWNRGNDLVMAADSFSNYQQRSLWGNLKSYGGLVLDGFLLPQILLNMFWNSKSTTLSHSFYIGNTLVRLLPHAYDLYRAHKYVQQYPESNIYANHGADFYSTAWDVVIPLGGLLFALIIYLQQRFGGRCIFPQRFRELAAYEKVPLSSDAELPDKSSSQKAPDLI